MLVHLLSGSGNKRGNDSISCHRWLAVITDIQLTFLSLLPEWDHLVELSLYQPISLLFIQPFTAWESLLYSGEWAVNHNLQRTQVLLNYLIENEHILMHLRVLVEMYLLAVPPSTKPSVVVSNGDSAQGTEECSKLDIKDVC